MRESPMFSFFRKLSPEQEAVKELKKMRKDIIHCGGPEKVCYVFLKYLERDPLYNQSGVVSVEDAPYSKATVILASLDLLNSWKKTPDDDPDIKYLMQVMSKRVYIAGLSMLNNQEISELLRSIGCEPGELILDIVRADMLGNKLLAETQRRQLIAEDAWNKWRENDIDVFEVVKNA